MSKAFTKESEDDEADLPEFRIPPGTKNYLTPGGYRQLREEFKRLMDVERPDMVRVVSWAASNGDRSENGDYHYGKRRLREIDRRIRFLTKRLDMAEVVDPAARQDVEQIFFGATVRYLDGAAQEHTITIVGIDEAEPLKGRISWIAPLARGLTRARAGDVVTLRTPGGAEEIEILEVSYCLEEPDAA